MGESVSMSVALPFPMSKFTYFKVHSLLTMAFSLNDPSTKAKPTEWDALDQQHLNPRSQTLDVS